MNQKQFQIPLQPLALPLPSRGICGCIKDTLTDITFLMWPFTFFPPQNETFLVLSTLSPHHVDAFLWFHGNNKQGGAEVSSNLISEGVADIDSGVSVI